MEQAAKHLKQMNNQAVIETRNSNLQSRPNKEKVVQQKMYTSEASQNGAKLN